MIRHSQFKHFPVYSFIEWKRYESDMLSELVYHLKRFSSQQIWQDLSIEIVKEFKMRIPKQQPIIFIPVPGHSTSYHTHFFAKSLAQQMNGQVYINALINSMSKQQKQQTRQQRQQIALGWSEEFTQRVPNGAVVVLVDDIVTTGSTMSEASRVVHKQLVQLGKRTVTVIGLTLFYRT